MKDALSIKRKKKHKKEKEKTKKKKKKHSSSASVGISFLMRKEQKFSRVRFSLMYVYRKQLSIRGCMSVKHDRMIG